jgi:hypothetical protein
MFERRLEPGQVSVLMIAATDGPPPIEVLRVPDMVHGASPNGELLSYIGIEPVGCVAYPIGEH